ncbi:MAG: archease, partial [Candidatus Omnitrophica bacterium]|nr:archease [Candidatus Omnitrophota bacterium]
MSRSKVRLLHGPFNYTVDSPKLTVEKKKYALFEHTADIGLRVRAKTLKILFQNTALAAFDIIAEKGPSKVIPEKTITIKLKAGTQEELFINWLNELISLSATKEMIFTGFNIRKITLNSIEAQATGKDIAYFRVNTEIKAATYHELKS